jgi:hypothetical protein
VAKFGQSERDEQYDHHWRTKRICTADHTRMPVILPEEHRDAWFSGAAGKEILLLRLNGVDYWIVLEVTMLIFQSSPLRISIEE